MPLAGINPKIVTAFSSAQVTASTTGDGTTSTAVIKDVARYSSAQVFLTVGTVQGTSPTMNVYIQTQMPDQTTWTDIMSFAQVTSSTSNQTGALVSAAIAPYATTDASLAASSIKATHMGSTWRVKIVCGGTNPRFNTTALYIMFC